MNTNITTYTVVSVFIANNNQNNPSITSPFALLSLSSDIISGSVHCSFIISTVFLVQTDHTLVVII